MGGSLSDARSTCTILSTALLLRSCTSIDYLPREPARTINQQGCPSGWSRCTRTSRSVRLEVVDCGVFGARPSLGADIIRCEVGCRSTSTDWKEGAWSMSFCSCIGLRCSGC